MFITINTLRHNPTVKTEAIQYGYSDLTYGFLGYPVSQAADITFCKADLVPVGEDQKPHLEVARKLVRRFNNLYNVDILKEPEILLSDCPRLIGLDGNNKMGKSLNNSIYLSDDEKTVAEKVKNAKTDAARVRVNDKGHPEVCVVFAYQKIFNKNEYANICDMCTGGLIGCVACKKQLILALNELLEPIREKEMYYNSHRNKVKEILYAGTEYANMIGEETMEGVKAAMRILI